MSDKEIDSGFLKNIGILSSIGIVGNYFHKRMHVKSNGALYSSIDAHIDRVKASKERYYATTAFTNVDTSDIAQELVGGDQVPFSLASELIEGEGFDFSDPILDSANVEDLIKDGKLINIEDEIKDDELLKRLYKSSEEIADQEWYNKAVRSQGRSSINLEKDYRGITNYISGWNGVDIEDIKESAVDYRIDVVHGATKNTIVLPKYRQNYIMYRNNMLKPIHYINSRDYAKNEIHAFTYGKQVMDSITSKDRFTSNDPLQSLVSTIDNAVRAPATNLMSGHSVVDHTGSVLVSVDNIRKSILKNSDAQLRVNTSEMHGANLTLIGFDGVRIDTGFQIRGEVSSEGQIVEGIYRGTKISAKTREFTGTQGQTRAHFLSKLNFTNREITATDMAATMGVIDEDVLNDTVNLVRGTRKGKFHERIPGGSMRTTFAIGNVPHGMEGQMALFARRSKSGNLNLDKFAVDEYKHISLKGGKQILDNGEPQYFTSPETNKLLKKYLAGDTTVRAGEVLGYDRKTNKLIVAETNGYIVSHSFNKGYPEFKIVNERPIQAQDKFMHIKHGVGMVTTIEEYTKGYVKHGDKNITTSVMQIVKEVGHTDGIVSHKAYSKIIGDGGGWGILQKTLDDVVTLEVDRIKNNTKAITMSESVGIAGARLAPRYTYKDMTIQKIKDKLRGVIKSAFGDDIDDIISDVVINDDYQVGIITKGSSNPIHQSKVDKVRVLGDIEDAITEAFNGKPERLRKFDEFISEQVTNTIGVKYSMSVGHTILARNADKPLLFMPTLVWDSNKQLNSITVDHHAAAHISSRGKYYNTAGAVRGSSGFVKGAKIGIELQESARNQGLHGLEKYFASLQDYKMDYIFDRYRPIEVGILGRKGDLVSSGGSSYIKLGESTRNVLTISKLRETGLLEQLAAENMESKVSSMFYLNRKTIQDMVESNIFPDTEAIHRILSIHNAEDALTLADIGVTNMGNQIGANTAVTTSKSNYKELLRLSLEAKDKDGTFLLELPMDVEMSKNGISSKGRFISLSTLTGESLFDLVRKESDGKTAANSVMRDYVTGGEYWANQMKFIQQVAGIEQSLRATKNNQQEARALQTKLQLVVDNFISNRNSAFDGKIGLVTSSLRTRVPLSMGAKAIAADMLTVNTIKNVSARTDQLFLSRDDFVRIETSGKLQTYDQVVHLARNAEEAEKVNKRAIHQGIASSDKGVKPSLSRNRLKKITHLMRELPKRIANDSLTPDDLKHFQDVAAETIETLTENKKLFQRKAGVGDIDTAINELMSFQKTGKLKHNERVTNVLRKLSSRSLQLNQTVAHYLKPRSNREKHARVMKVLIEQIEKGDRVETILINRPPNISSMADRGFHIKSDSFISQSAIPGITADAMQKIATVKGVNIKEIQNLYSKYRNVSMAISRVSADAFNLDFDADYMSGIAANFSALDKISKDLGLDLDIYKELNISKSAANLAETDIKTLSIIQNLFGETSGTDLSGNPMLRPYSLSAAAMQASMSSNNIDIAKMKLETIDKYIKTISNDPDQQGKITKAVLSYLKTFGVKGDSLANVKVLAGLSDDFHISSNIDSGMGSQLNINNTLEETARDINKTAAAKASASVSNVMIDAGIELNNTEHNILKKATRASAAAYKKTIDDIARHDQHSLGILKIGTPRADRLTRTFQGLVTLVSNTDGELAMYLDALSNEFSQETISQKKGRPFTLKYLEELMDKLHKGEIDTTDPESVKNLFTNSRVADLHTQDTKAILQLGIAKTEQGITLDNVKEYLNLKLKAQGEMVQINKDAALSIAEDIKNGSRSPDNLSKKFISIVEGRSASSKIGFRKESVELNTIFNQLGINIEDMIGVDTANIAYTHTEDSINNFRVESKRLEAVTKHIDVHKQNKKIIQLASIHNIIEGRTGIDIADIAGKIKKSASLLRGDRGIVDLMEDTLTRINATGAPAERAVSGRGGYVFNSIMRLATAYHNKYGDKWDPNRNKEFMKALSYVSVEEVEKGAERISVRKEIAKKIFINEKAKSISTIMDYKPISETIGKGRYNIAKFTEDGAIRKASSKNIRSVLLGAFAGTVLAQTINTMVSGYSIPELKHTVGKGGEYYEDRGGILGKELEIGISPQPPRIMPLYGNNDIMGIGQNINNIKYHGMQYANSAHSANKYETSFKGRTVR